MEKRKGRFTYFFHLYPPFLPGARLPGSSQHIGLDLGDTERPIYPQNPLCPLFTGAESRPAIGIPTTAHLQLGQVMDETPTRGTHCDRPLLGRSASSTRDEGQSTGEAQPPDGGSPALQEMDSTACPPGVLTLDTKDK